MSAIVALGLGKIQSPAISAWNLKIEERMSQTSNALSQVKSIKMVALEKPVSRYLQRLRASEITAFKAGRKLAILATVTG